MKNNILKQLKNNRSGFTFVELLVVIVIMAVLTAASANYLFAQGGSKARDTERRNDIGQVAGLIEQFVASYGEPPSGDLKNRKAQKYASCKSNNYGDLMKCFKELNYTRGEGLIKLAEDPKQGIKNDKDKIYMYLYASNNNTWKVCALLENQTDPDLNDDYSGSGALGSEEGNRTYCLVSSNRYLSDVTEIKGVEDIFTILDKK